MADDNEVHVALVDMNDMELTGGLQMIPKRQNVGLVEVIKAVFDEEVLFKVELTPTAVMNDDIMGKTLAHFQDMVIQHATEEEGYDEEELGWIPMDEL